VTNLKKKLFTVWVFARLNTKRFFRDRLALFFGILFPVIFLFIFGGINSGDNNVSFNVAVINHSHSAFATQFEKGLKDSKTFKVKDNITTFAQAQQKMQQSQIDGTIVLPADFGAQKAGQPNPSGQAQVYYTRNNEQAGQTLANRLLRKASRLTTEACVPSTMRLPGCWVLPLSVSVFSARSTSFRS
jgi:ABC-type Na+ efflux pump permease subunit